jgi:hypothetical protein
MKTSKYFIQGIAALFALCSLSNCEQKITVESVVHPDGAIDRTIVFTEVDSSKANTNIFGIDVENGWETKMEPVLQDNKDPGEQTYQTKREKVKGKYNIIFHKRFASVDEVNKVLNTPNDTLFRINSSFEKKFRWFYTYINYTDTYVSINRFDQLLKEDYFTKEDFAFINRMPESGKSITKADSIYLDLLEEKIGDFYALALYEEHFKMMLDAMNKNNLEPRWTDSLKHRKRAMSAMLTKKDNDKMLEEAFMLPLIDSLQIGFPLEKIKDDYKSMFIGFNPRIKFMGEVVSQAEFTHIIKMPWEVVSTNADSVNGTSLYWRPLTLKFLLNDYTMSAESRKMNLWTVIISLLFVIISAGLFWKKRKV